MADRQLLRQIPKVDEILACECIEMVSADMPHGVLMDAVHTVLDELRAQILQGTCDTVPPVCKIAGQAVQKAQRQMQRSLRRVINATGVVLHTNLGRARMSECAVQAACEAAGGYSTLEYDLAAGTRGSRYQHVEKLVCELTGAESAMVVNNNAAAVLLILSEMVRGKEAIVSRGELVEIGGSFRVPEIMEQSGGILREVGTTNKTHLRDYAAAIDPEKTGALLKVHTSNYKIVGFTESVSVEELAQLGKEQHIPVIYDIGSGAMVDFHAYGLPEEPMPARCIRAGADIVCFSGDKLLGGPQAGIIAGKKEYIERMKHHPLTRALRVDKMTLAALEATLALYRDEAQAVQQIPTLSMLTLSPQVLEERARMLCEMIRRFVPSAQADTVHLTGQVGGGSMPAQELDSMAVELFVPGCSAAALEQRLRTGRTPVIVRVAHDRVLLDVRTIAQQELAETAEMVRESVNGDGAGV